MDHRQPRPTAATDHDQHPHGVRRPSPVPSSRPGQAPSNPTHPPPQQRLEPTWEKFAEDVEELGLPVKVVKVNCVEEMDVCKAQRVQAFPTLRFLKNGAPVTGADYR